MNERLNRVGKVSLLFMAGFTLILAVNIMPGGARERAIDRLVLSGLYRLSEGEQVADAIRTAHGRTMWRLPDSGDVIVRAEARGYQSRLDLLVRLDAALEYRNFHLIAGNEGPHVIPRLRRGDLDALSGASVTEGAIRAAVTRVQRDLERTREESQ